MASVHTHPPEAFLGIVLGRVLAKCYIKPNRIFTSVTFMVTTNQVCFIYAPCSQAQAIQRFAHGGQLGVSGVRCHGSMRTALARMSIRSSRTSVEINMRTSACRIVASFTALLTTLGQAASILYQFEH